MRSLSMLTIIAASAEDDSASLLSVGRSVERNRQSEKLVQRADATTDVAAELESAVAGKSCYNFLKDDGKVHGVSLGFDTAVNLPAHVYAIKGCARFLEDHSNVDFEAKCSSRAKMLDECMKSARKVCVWSNKQFKAGEKEVSKAMQKALLPEADIKEFLGPFGAPTNCRDLFAGKQPEDITVNDLKLLVPVVPKWVPCDADTIDMSNPSPACLLPVLAEKRHPDEPDSYIPSVYSRLAFSPATHGVHDVDLGFYRGNGKILVYSTSKYLVEMNNGKLFNSGVHTSEIFVPLYHFDRAGFSFDFVTRDGGAIALEEWTYALATGSDGLPGYEPLLRETAAKHSEGMSHPMRTAEIPKDLDGYLGIFIPGGHGPLVEFHLDTDLGALLRQAHAMELPVMSLCHGPTALRAAALGGEFPFQGYKTAMFPDATDKWSPSVGYLPGQLKPEDWAESKLVELGMEIMNTEADDFVYQDRELLTGASNQASQKFSELVIPILLAKHQTNSTEMSSLVSMVDESCEDASTGCKGGCYLGPSEVFFNDCLIGRAVVIGIIMEKPKFITGDHCTSAGFQPLILPDNAGNSVPDGCYGGADSRVSFYTSDQAWFWETTASGGFNLDVDCPAWQEANPTCFGKSA